jgi:hypothetical protein
MEHLQREADNSMQSKSSRVMMWAENNKAARYGVVQALGSPNCISLPQMTDIELGFNVALLGFDLALVQSFLAILLFLPFGMGMFYSMPFMLKRNLLFLSYRCSQLRDCLKSQ